MCISTCPLPNTGVLTFFQDVSTYKMNIKVIYLLQNCTKSAVAKT